MFMVQSEFILTFPRQSICLTAYKSLTPLKIYRSSKENRFYTSMSNRWEEQRLNILCRGKNSDIKSLSL